MLFQHSSSISVNLGYNKTSQFLYFGSAFTQWQHDCDSLFAQSFTTHVFAFPDNISSWPVGLNHPLVCTWSPLPGGEGIPPAFRSGGGPNLSKPGARATHKDKRGHHTTNFNTWTQSKQLGPSKSTVQYVLLSKSCGESATVYPLP